MWDDECADASSDGASCSLDALQRRAKVQPAEDLSMLCSRAASVCRDSDDDGAEHLTVRKLRAVLAVANSTLQAFLGATGLHLLEEDLVPCKVLCEASAALVQKYGVKLPPAPDVGCFRNAAGKDLCNVDLSSASLKTRFNLEDEDVMEGIAPKRRLSVRHVPVRWQNPFQYSFEKEVQTYSEELALRILYMFHVYPRAFNTFVASKDAAPEDWHDKLANFNLVARVFIVNAIRNLRLHKTQDSLSVWFGRAALGDNLEDTRREILRILNSAVHVMDSAEFMYNHSACDEDTFAFVFPSGSDGVPELQGSFRKNQKGQYVIYVCPLTVYAESMGLLAEAVQTMVHESSHHEFAYTDDVYSCSRSHYLWLQVDGLLALNGSTCSGSLKPRYSIGGMSCSVPGHEILQLSNWTRQRYEVGLWNDPKCPANMIPIKTAEECRGASELVGLDFKKEENATDFPQGCYHMDIGNFEGVYFNNGNGTNGANGRGSQMLCQTLPTLPEVGNLSGCPPKYSIRRPGHGCELALPFEIAEPNMTRCPDDLAHVVKVSYCLEAGDIFGLTYGGHIASENYPYGCFKDLQSNFITFNILEGSANSQASLVCRQPFSFNVFDPRLMYTMTALRFSQDGDAALFSLQDMAFNADHCSMAYGKYKCKALAKRNALKALLNADSFAYYVMDAGAPE